MSDDKEDEHFDRVEFDHDIGNEEPEYTYEQELDGKERDDEYRDES